MDLFSDEADPNRKWLISPDQMMVASMNLGFHLDRYDRDFLQSPFPAGKLFYIPLGWKVGSKALIRGPMTAVPIRATNTDETVKDLIKLGESLARQDILPELVMFAMLQSVAHNGVKKEILTLQSGCTHAAWFQAEWDLWPRLTLKAVVPMLNLAAIVYRGFVDVVFPVAAAQGESDLERRLSKVRAAVRG